MDAAVGSRNTYIQDTMYRNILILHTDGRHKQHARFSLFDANGEGAIQGVPSAQLAVGVVTLCVWGGGGRDSACVCEEEESGGGERERKKRESERETERERERERERGVKVCVR